MTPFGCCDVRVTNRSDDDVRSARGDHGAGYPRPASRRCCRLGAGGAVQGVDGMAAMTATPDSRAQRAAAFGRTGRKVYLSEIEAFAGFHHQGLSLVAHPGRPRQPRNQPHRRGQHPPGAPQRALIAGTNDQKIGWGTWIRTKAARVRAGSSTAKLSPIAEAMRGATTPAGRASTTRGAWVQLVTARNMASFREVLGSAAGRKPLAPGFVWHDHDMCHHDMRPDMPVRAGPQHA